MFTQDIPDICNVISPRLPIRPGWGPPWGWGSSGTHLRVYHEPLNVLNAVEGQNLSIHRSPQAFPVGVAVLDLLSKSTDAPRIGYGDLQIGTLDAALVAQEVLSKYPLYRVNRRLMLGHLSFQIGPEGIAVGVGKGRWSGHVEVVEEVGDMEENGMTSLCS